MTNQVMHVPAESGPHVLVIGSVTVGRLLGAAETGGELSLVELRGLPGSGPGAHVDPWRESFYVLDGELTFQFEEGATVDVVTAGPGDVVSIPAGVPHAFSVTGPAPARYVMVGTPAGIDAFFADAGEAVPDASLPSEQVPFDRDRLLAAFEAHGLAPHSFTAERVGDA